jgi:hypothetical protein
MIVWVGRKNYANKWATFKTMVKTQNHLKQVEMVQGQVHPPKTALTTHMWQIKSKKWGVDGSKCGKKFPTTNLKTP